MRRMVSRARLATRIPSQMQRLRHRRADVFPTDCNPRPGCSPFPRNILSGTATFAGEVVRLATLADDSNVRVGLPLLPKADWRGCSSRRAAAGQSLQDARSVPSGCPESPARPALSPQSVADAAVWRDQNKKTGSIPRGCCRLNRFGGLARCSEFHRLADGIFEQRSHQLARLCDLNESISLGESPAGRDRRELQVPEPAGRASGGSSGRETHRESAHSAPELRDRESLAGRG